MVPGLHHRRPEDASEVPAAGVPVADAVSIRPALHRPSRLKLPREPLTLRQAYMGWLLFLVTWVYLQLLAGIGEKALKVAVALRYMMLPMIVIAIILNLQRKGPRQLIDSVAIVLPLFIIGVVSTIFSDDQVNGARSLAFWVLGILAASVIGDEVPPKRVMTWLFLLLFAIDTGSMVMAIVFPTLGRIADLRVAGGAWIGMLLAKNQLGSVCVLSLIIGALVGNLRLPIRAAMLSVSAVCLYYSHSGGAVAQAFAGAIYILFVLLLRHFPLNDRLRSAALTFVLVLGSLSAVILRSFFLEMLGRDPSLTGRTRIWPAYLGRALDYWVIGAGPGSFTQVSSATIDIGTTFEDLGANIHSPHNVFIAAFGEVGLFGLIAFVSIFLYFALLAPFRGSSRENVALGAIAIVSIVGGMGEAREVFGLGFGMFLLILTNTVARRNDSALSLDSPDSVRLTHQSLLDGSG